MGVDSRGVQRGKCICGECDSYEAGRDGPQCGYCGCIPTKHAQLATAAQENGEKIDEKKKNEENMEDEDFGWFPSPTGPYPTFCNEILPEFFRLGRRSLPDKEEFRRKFIEERKRTWKLKGKNDEINRRVNFIMSDNAAAAGRFLKDENFKVKAHDATTIANNIEALAKEEKQLVKILYDLRKDDGKLFNTKGTRVSRGNEFRHQKNIEFIPMFDQLLTVVTDAITVLKEAKKRAERIFPTCRQGNPLKRKSRMVKQNKTKAKTRKQARYEENEEKLREQIFYHPRRLDDPDYFVESEDFILHELQQLKWKDGRYLKSLLEKLPMSCITMKSLLRELPNSVRKCFDQSETDKPENQKANPKPPTIVIEDDEDENSENSEWEEKYESSQDEPEEGGSEEDSSDDL